MSILNLADLRTQVNNDIKTNGVRAITGNIMNVNLIDMIDSIESDYDGITGGLDSRLTSIETSALLILQDPSTGWDASVGTFPGGGTAKAGYYWNVSTAGTVDGIAFDIGDSLLAILDNASTGTYAANWSKKDDIDSVISVAGKVGAITLVAADITDFDAEVSNNTDVAANTAKVSADGSINTHSDVDTSTVAPVIGEALIWDGSNWTPDSAAASVGAVNEVQITDGSGAFLSGKFKAETFVTTQYLSNQANSAASNGHGLVLAPTSTALNAPSGGSVQLAIGNAPKLFVDANGDVGIGTGNAVVGHKLHVKESTNSASDFPFLVTNLAGTSILNVRADARIGINTTTLDTANTITATPNHQYLLSATGNFQNIATMSGIRLSSTGTATNHIIGLDLTANTNNKTYLGNVAANTSGTLSDLQSSFLIYNGAGDLTDTTSRGINLVTKGQNASFNIRTSNTIYDTTNTIRLKVDKVGNVGIGTGAGTPAAKLQVKGSGATSATSALLVENSAATSLLEVKDDGEMLALGNFGIGGVTPVRRLDVLENSSALVANFSSGSGATSFLTFGSTTVAGDRVRLGINGANITGEIDYIERFRVTTVGDFGIGETVPSARLHVKGSGATSATSALLITNSTPADLLEVKDDGNIFIGIAPNTNTAAAEVLVRNTSTGEVELAGAPIPILQTKVTISNAQLLAINSTPITLIAAQGAGKVAYIHSAMIKVNVGSTVETTQATQNMVIGYPTVGDICTLGTSLAAWGTAAEIISEPITGLGAMLNADNSIVAFAGKTGNFVEFDGTMDVYVTYEVITL